MNTDGLWKEGRPTIDREKDIRMRRANGPNQRIANYADWKWRDQVALCVSVSVSAMHELTRACIVEIWSLRAV